MNDDMHDVLEIWTMGEQEMWCIDVYHRFHRPTVGLRFDQPVLVYYHSDGIGSHPNFRAKYEKSEFKFHVILQCPLEVDLSVSSVYLYTKKRQLLSKLIYLSEMRRKCGRNRLSD